MDIDEQKAVWDKIAVSWDKHRKKVPTDVYEFLRDIEGKILDIGCGNGRNFIAKQDQELYGIDFSSEMIKLARENAKEKGINVELEVMDATDLKFEDNFFDACMCNSVIHCIQTKEGRIKVLSEIYRVLKKDGKAFISAWGGNSPRLKNKEKESEVPWTVEGEKVMRYTYRYDLDEFIEDLHEVGFKVVKFWEDMNVNAIVFKN